jgi:predicted dehydrogenase
MTTIRFGVIGGGLMGREFASAAARWSHLLEMPARPEIVSVCSRRTDSLDWFRKSVSTATQFTTDYREVLANPAVEAVYIAVPHMLHESIYVASIASGKHVLGEKPFGIDQAANRAIVQAAAANPSVLVRCSSQFPFFPAVQRIAQSIDTGAFGQIIEVNSGFLHSSDLDPNKPSNWKRRVETNGAYGCMGDLGMHVCHIPFRAGWFPRNVRAILSKIVTTRPDGSGGNVPCDTWDNASLCCEVSGGNRTFPMNLRMHRIAPGQRNTWYLEILGTQRSMRWSSANPKLLEQLDYRAGGEQVWQQIQTGYEPAFKTITGPIFEFGFTDAILQMWASYLCELSNGRAAGRFSGCVTPAETMLSHRLFTAALESQERSTVVELKTD